MSKKKRTFLFGNDLNNSEEKGKKPLDECKNVQEYLAQFNDFGEKRESNQLPPVQPRNDVTPPLKPVVSAPYPTNPVADAAREAVRSYLENVSDGSNEETAQPVRTKPEPIQTKAETPAPKVEAAQETDNQRRHRSSIYLKKMYDHDCIAVQDRLGDVMLFPLQHTITARIIPGKEGEFIHAAATVIALSATPSAIFTQDDFADYVEAANITAINPKSTFIGTMDEFLYAFRIWSYLEKELEVVKKELDARYGEHIFASSIMLMMTGIYPRSPLSVPKYRRLMSTTIYDTKWEETARDNFIKFLIGEYDRGRADEPLEAYDLEDFITYDLLEEIPSFLEVGESEEEESEEEAEDAAVAAMMQQAFEEMSKEEDDNKEVVINDGNGSYAGASGDVGRPVQEVVNKSGRRERVNSVSGQGFGEMVQNVYAQARVQQSVQLSAGTNERSGGDGHWPTLEEIEKDAAQKVKEQEAAQARSVNDRPGTGGGEAPKEEIKKEEKEEEQLVIPVNRGGKG